jgi:hypothetical protein
MIRWFNRRTLAAILLIVGAGMLQGCTYDPSIGAYVPCCAAYYPAYGPYAYPVYGGYPYPANAYPYGYGAPVVVQSGWGGGYWDGITARANWMGANDGAAGHR